MHSEKGREGGFESLNSGGVNQRAASVLPSTKEEVIIFQSVSQETAASMAGK